MLLGLRAILAPWHTFVPDLDCVIGTLVWQQHCDSYTNDLIYYIRLTTIMIAESIINHVLSTVYYYL